MTHHPNKEQIIERMKKTQKEQISKMTKEERQEKWGQLGEKNGMYGRTHTDEVKQIFSNLHKGNTYNLGRKASQETKDKLSKARKGKNTINKNPVDLIIVSVIVVPNATLLVILPAIRPPKA